MPLPKQNLSIALLLLGKTQCYRTDKQAVMISTVVQGASKYLQNQWLMHNPSRYLVALPPLDTDAHTQHLTVCAAFLQNHPHQREATPEAERSLKQGRENAKKQRKQGTLPEMLLYRRLYVLKLRCLRFVARSLTKVRPVGSKTHRTVMQTLKMTTQLHTTIPTKKEEESGALPLSLGSIIVLCSSPQTSHVPPCCCRADRGI